MWSILVAEVVDEREMRGGEDGDEGLRDGVGQRSKPVRRADEDTAFIEELPSKVVLFRGRDAGRRRITQAGYTGRRGSVQAVVRGWSGGGVCQAAVQETRESLVERRCLRHLEAAASGRSFRAIDRSYEDASLGDERTLHEAKMKQCWVWSRA